MRSSGLHDLGIRLSQVLHVGILNQLLGADGGAQAALDTLGVVDPGQAVFHGDGIVGADLLTLAAADAAHSTGTGGGSTLCHRVAGNDHIAARLHRNNQVAGADIGTGHAAHTQVFVNNGDTVLDGDRAILTGSGAGAVAQTAELTGQGTGAANLGGSQTVVEALVIGLDLGTLHQVALSVVLLGTGAADQCHLPGDCRSLDTHDGGHGLGALIAAGSTGTDGGFAVQNSLCVGTAAGIAAAAAVGTGQAGIQLVQTGIGLHLEDLGCCGQHQTENQAQTAQQRNCNQNLHTLCPP